MALTNVAKETQRPNSELYTLALRALRHALALVEQHGDWSSEGAHSLRENVALVKRNAKAHMQLDLDMKPPGGLRARSGGVLDVPVWVAAAGNEESALLLDDGDALALALDARLALTLHLAHARLAVFRTSAKRHEAHVHRTFGGKRPAEMRLPFDAARERRVIADACRAHSLNAPGGYSDHGELQMPPFDGSANAMTEQDNVPMATEPPALAMTSLAEAVRLLALVAAATAGLWRRHEQYASMHNATLASAAEWQHLLRYRRGEFVGGTEGSGGAELLLQHGEFDLQAQEYDEHLANLGKSDHRHMAQLLRNASVIERIVALHTRARDGGGAGPGICALDLGAGTGTTAHAISAEWSKAKTPALPALRWVGVDMSSKMLALAHARSLYARLDRAELVSWLERRGFRARERFEGADIYGLGGGCESAPLLVAAGDVFIYLESLRPVLDGIGAALAAGGFAVVASEAMDPGEVCAEITPDDHSGLPAWALRFSLRSAHSAAYIADAARSAGLELEAHRVRMIRYESDRPVHGHFMLLHKPGHVEVNDAVN
eukprot:g7198.t1